MPRHADPSLAEYIHACPPESEAGGVLTIDLDAIVANWRELARRAAPAACAAVVKADGYGCGIAPVAVTLAKAGCNTFFVAHLAEGRSVRAVAPEAAIYVLNGLAPGTALAQADAGLRPVLGSLAELAEWRAFVRASGWQGGAALHVDTGMNRLGLSFAEAEWFSREHASERAGLTLVMSHLACAETPDHALNAKQMAAFHEVRALFPGIAGSLANSSGVFLDSDAHHDLVRPGVALFGGNPTPSHLNPMQPVVTLRGRIVQVRTVDAGETVGYGATWTAQQPTRIAVVSIGYADGVLRAASCGDDKPGADAIVAGHRCPLVGVVSMDLLAVDVSALPDELPRRGDFVTLIGDGTGVDDLAAHAGTIGYEILTNLGGRYARIYRGR
jgi:alanine racemase